MRATVHGVGVLDADYTVKVMRELERIGGVRRRELVWICPYYQSWRNMIMRCYCKPYQDRHPSYEGCSVEKEWLTFSKFKAWMDTQDWKGKQLDKDLLVEGNKVYSPTTCAFVSSDINNFFHFNNSSSSGLPVGVRKRGKKYTCRTFRNGHIGTFVSIDEALAEYTKQKAAEARELALSQTDDRVTNALIGRYC